MKKDNMENIRHSLSHILAMAVLKKFSQAKFADIVGIPVATLRNWEQGRTILLDELNEILDKEI